MPDPHRKAFPEFLAFAHTLADRSGAVILPRFRRRIAIEAKATAGFFDPVTAADRAAERAIRTMINRRWPDHGIFGEELGEKPASSPYRWIVDPIDGTRSFILGLPVWGTLIALTSDGQPLLGLMDQPYTRERFWSAANASYFRGPDDRTTRLRTRACPDLASAMLTTTHPDLFAQGRERSTFQRLKAEVRDTRYGGDCYAYCLLAAGHIDIVMEAGLKAHDIAALIPIIERAGGIVTDWKGGSVIGGGNVLACGDPVLHERVLALIS
ncbi:MAG: hypothetical protein RLZ98_3538 [Pseudomonadota bacterium]